MKMLLKKLSLDAYQAAVKELDLFVVSRPENVDIVSAEADKPHGCNSSGLCKAGGRAV